MGEAAFDDVDQQALVGFGAALGKRGFQVQVQVHRAQLHTAAGLLGHHLQLDVFFRLQANHQAVDRLVRRVLEDGERQVGELDHDFGLARRHALAGAQKNRHVGPAPVVDVGLERHKGFGGAAFGNVGFLQVACRGVAVGGAGAVLAAHGVAGHVGHGHGPQRAQHLELFVAHGVRVERHRRLHGHDAQQLQQVVLHHVAHGAGAVVKTRAAAHAHGFSHRDLHALDVRAAPQRLKNGVAKAQHHQVLNRLFAQVMVDAEDLLFLEVPAHVVVDLAGGSQVVAQRLFQHHAGALVDQAGAVQVGANAHKQAGCGGQVVDAVRAALHGGGKGGEILCLGGVHADVVQPLQKAGPGGFGKGFVFNEAAHLVLYERDKGGAVPALAAQRVDARGGRQVVVQVGHVQRGQQLAHREVAHPAKDHQIERASRRRAGG